MSCAAGPSAHKTGRVTPAMRTRLTDWLCYPGVSSSIWRRAGTGGFGALGPTGSGSRQLGDQRCRRHHHHIALLCRYGSSELTGRSVDCGVEGGL